MASLEQNRIECSVSIFFKLPINDTQLLDVLNKLDDFDEVGKEITKKIGDIQFGPTKRNLGNYFIEESEYNFTLIHDRFLLEISGCLDNMNQVISDLFSVFSQDYSLEKTCRFIEFAVNEHFIEKAGLLSKLQDKVHVTKPAEIESTFNTEFNPWGINLVSPLSPVDDDWFSINIRPEAMSSSGRLVLRIIKRYDKELNRMVDFLEKISDIENQVVNWLEN
ncbi:MAG: hypothetical protein ACTSP4_14310 [Candidatus Hodarchaeales archaeon]